MSDVASTSDSLNIREQIARIDRNQAEIQKLFAEAGKLKGEEAKRRRDRFLAAVIALAATLGAIAALAPAILRSLGGHS